MLWLFMRVSSCAQGKGEALSLTSSLYLKASKARLWLIGVLQHSVQ